MWLYGKKVGIDLVKMLIPLATRREYRDTLGLASQRLLHIILTMSVSLLARLVSKLSTVIPGTLSSAHLSSLQGQSMQSQLQHQP